jgi:high affinity cGMP-specific 3',5'-cyclic phosphodiesterase 9
MTQEDMRAVIYSLADIPESDKDVIIKITKEDGTFVPMSVHIAPNSPSEPYILNVKSSKYAIWN